MRLSTLLAVVATTTSSLVFAQTEYLVPVPWLVTNISISNTRHGTGGSWSLKIIDTPTTTPQGFNTTCRYFSSTSYEFAIDGYPVNEPCANPNVTFGFFPSPLGFTLNVTHLYGNCGSAAQPTPCNDNGTWTFSTDDIRGQENDVQNNFGQSGYFSLPFLNMYPLRAVPSSKCEFC